MGYSEMLYKPEQGLIQGALKTAGGKGLKGGEKLTGEYLLSSCRKRVNV